MGSINRSKLTSHQIQSYEESGRSLELYMKDLEKTPPLSKEEQSEILKEYIDGGRKDKALGHKLIITNQRLVAFVCKRYANRKFHYIDLIQEGNVGMLDALEKFDYEKANGGSFIHFAHKHIFSRVSKYVEKNRYITKLGHQNGTEKISYNLYKYATLENDLGLSHPSRETVLKIAEELDVKVSDVEYVIKFVSDNNYVTTMSDDDSDSDEHKSFMNLVYNDEDDVERIAIKEDEQRVRCERIDVALKKLNEQELIVVKERHLVQKEDKKTFKELGTKLGITGERVRQIEINAMARLQKHFKYDTGGV